MPKLTDKFLRGLKPPKSGQVDVWDDLLPSFGVRVGTTGRKSFFVGTRIKGKYRRITLKPPYDQLSLADARERAKLIMADAQAGVGPELRKKREEAGTFGAVAAAFMQDFAHSHRTRDEMQRKIDVDLAEWHDRQITEITRKDIKELIRVKARTSPIAANRLLSLIAKIFNWAVKEELIQASPAIQIDRPGQEVERERSLTADEIKTAWEAFDRLGYPWGPLFKMLLVTGQRRGEVAGMKWSEISADGWRIPGERSKNGKGHLVPTVELGSGRFSMTCHRSASSSLGQPMPTSRCRAGAGLRSGFKSYAVRWSPGISTTCGGPSPRTCAAWGLTAGCEQAAQPCRGRRDHAYMTAIPPIPSRRPRWSDGQIGCARSLAARRPRTWCNCGSSEEAVRLTSLFASPGVVRWDPDGDKLLVCSCAEHQIQYISHPCRQVMVGGVSVGVR